jgi:hypothetical protein
MYHMDGVSVMLFLRTYTDILSFSTKGHNVGGTSHKVGTQFEKVGIYRTKCEFLATSLTGFFNE